VDWLTIILFALALNADSFSTGIAYGVKRIRLPFLAIVVLSAMSAGAITVSMLFGHLICPYFSNDFAHRMGGILLFVLGIWICYQGVKSSAQTLETNIVIPETPDIKQQTTVQPVLRFKIKLGSLIIQVLSKPQCADLDSSGDISLSEAVILGFALAMDSFSAGFAVSILGFNIPFTAFAVGVGHILLIYPGMWLGRLAGTSRICSRISIFPGCILMLLGLYKLI